MGLRNIARLRRELAGIEAQLEIARTIRDFPMAVRRRLLSREQHRKLASTLFNRTWDLMEKKGRTADDDAEMIRTAHASRFHWEQIGTAKNFAVGEWQIARVYSILQMPESALYHAKRSLAYTRTKGTKFEDYQLPSVYEGLARAYATAGDERRARNYLRLAKQLAEKIKDPKDRKTILEQIASVPIKRQRDAQTQIPHH